MSLSSKYQASPQRPSGSSVLTYFAPGLCENAPHRLRSMRGPFSRYFCGNQVCHTCAGSTTWSSTLTIFGSSIEALPRPASAVWSLTLASGRVVSLAAGRLVDVGETGGLVGVGVGAVGETIGDPVRHVAGRRPDHTRVALARIHPPLQHLVE